MLSLSGSLISRKQAASRVVYISFLLWAVNLTLLSSPIGSPAWSCMNSIGKSPRPVESPRTAMIRSKYVNVCDFKWDCDGELPGSVSIVVPVGEVIHDRRKKFEENGDPKHLQYEQAFEREKRKKGEQNPELRRNYYLEDQVEAGNFISRERFLSCGRIGMKKNGVLIPCDELIFVIDWARTPD